jgi:cytidine deaminase
MANPREIDQELTDEEITSLMKKSQEAMENAYAKYSDFKVGAALLTKCGKTFTGEQSNF